MSGQEKLPVLKLPDGSTVNGGSNIVDWAKSHTEPNTQAPSG